MSNTDMHYYVAGGLSLDVVTAYIAKTEAHHQRWEDVQKELGAANLVVRDDMVVAFAFDADPPPDYDPLVLRPYTFKKVKFPPSVVVLCPRLNRKAGKALGARLDECPYPYDSLFEQATGLGMKVLGPSVRGARLASMGFEKLGEDIILTIPGMPNGESAGFPTGSRGISRSAYWLMREKEGANV